MSMYNFYFEANGGLSMESSEFITDQPLSEVNTVFHLPISNGDHHSKGRHALPKKSIKDRLGQPANTRQNGPKLKTIYRMCWHCKRRHDGPCWYSQKKKKQPSQQRLSTTTSAADVSELMRSKSSILAEMSLLVKRMGELRAAYCKLSETEKKESEYSLENCSESKLNE